MVMEETLSDRYLGTNPASVVRGDPGLSQDVPRGADAPDQRHAILEIANTLEELVQRPHVQQGGILHNISQV